MSFNLTSIAKSLADLVDWNRKGFDAHRVRMNNIADNTIVGSFVNSLEEYNATVEAAPTQLEIFNTWYRYSHHVNGLFPGLPAELLDWRYDEATGLFRNIFNSSSTIGVVSPLKYKQFVLDVDIWSTGKDDDLIGLTPCFYRDPVTGKEHTLSVFRTPGGLNRPLYEVAVNSNQAPVDNPYRVYNGSANVFWGNGASGALTMAEAGYDSGQASTGNISWVDQKTTHGGDGHVRLRVTRNNDIMTFQTSTWSAPDTLIPETLFTLDLSSHPRYNVFRSGAQYGFCSVSQANSFWRVREFSNPNDAIYRLDTGEVYSNKGGVWTFDPKLSLSNIRPKTFLLNPYTGKSYFFDQTDRIYPLASHMVK